MIQTETKLLVISPLPVTFLPQVWDWANEFRSQMMNDFAPDSYEKFRAIYDLMMERGGKTYGVFGGDESFLGVVWGDFLGDSVFLGHLVFSRELSSDEKLTGAKLAIQQWFQDGARKIVWESFADNIPFIRFLEKLGAVIEGRMREGNRRQGKLIDTVLLASFPQ